MITKKMSLSIQKSTSANPYHQDAVDFQKVGLYLFSPFGSISTKRDVIIAKG